MSRSLMIPGPGRLLVDHDRGADALLGHLPARPRAGCGPGRASARRPTFLLELPSRSSSPVRSRASELASCRLPQPYRNEPDGCAQACGPGRIGFRAPCRAAARSSRCALCDRRRPPVAVAAGLRPAGERRHATTGAQLFIEKCGTCHALKEAGTHADVGPNLDAAFARRARDGMDQDTIEGVVEAQIDEPPRQPSPTTPRPTCRADLVEGEDADDVAAYVGQVAGVPGHRAADPAGRPRRPGVPATAAASCHTLAAAERDGHRRARTSTRRCPAQDAEVDREVDRRPRRRDRPGLPRRESMPRPTSDLTPQDLKDLVDSCSIGGQAE